MVFRGIPLEDSNKLSRFNAGSFKSSRNRRKYETDKARRDEADTHAVLQSFKQSFLPERMDRPKAWVAAGKLNPETGVATRGVKRKLYLPPKALNAPRPKKRSAPSRFDRKAKPKEEPPKRLSQRQRARMMRAAKVGSKLVASHKASRKRSGRKAIEQIMMENEASKRAQVHVMKAIGLPTPPKPEPTVSTNLYVANLPKDVSKTDLQVIFGKFGVLDSIKIYEPRTEEERRRKKTIGFVSFSRRKDAEDALDALNDNITEQLKKKFPHWQEKIRLGWGNPLAKNNPTARIPSHLLGQVSMPSAISGSAAILAATLLASHRPESVQIPKGSTVHEITVPEDLKMKRIIDLLALKVAKDGMVFENLAISRNRNNKKFDFLFDTKSSVHMYYRWRTISLCFGDSLQGWNESPFQVIDEGAWWVPPRVTKTRPPDPYLRADDRDRRSSKRDRQKRDEFGRERSRSRERARERRSSKLGKRRSGIKADLGKNRLIPVGSRPLSETDRTQFMNLLRQLSDKRHNIREAMAFCLDNADKCTEVVEIISESLTIEKTKIPKKLARLYLVSDILHNSQAMVKNASAYRSELQKRLRDIFKSIRACWEKAEPSPAKEEFEKSVIKILSIWERWSLFPAFFVEGLRVIFKPELAKKDPPKPESKKKKKTEELDDILALALAGDLEAVDEDLDGEPLSDDLDGAPFDDGEPFDDVDGEPIPDGQPMDDGDFEFDGVPM